MQIWCLVLGIWYYIFVFLDKSKLLRGLKKYRPFVGSVQKAGNICFYSTSTNVSSPIPLEPLTST